MTSADSKANNCNTLEVRLLQEKSRDFTLLALMISRDPL